MDSGSLYSNMGPSMLGLEMSLHHQIPQQNPHHHHMQQPHHPPPHPHHPTIVSYAHQENADSSQQVVRQGFPFGNKGKNQSLNFSDDDEAGPGVSADNNSTDDGKRNNNSNSNSNRNCPWQRMKWTDNMVKLLIMVVYYIGDEVDNNNDPSGKKKGGGGGGGGGVGGSGGGGVLQKKGKWKSVSRAMMERGFYVSPQQCEDKFNDLNKRYKRVNDILGKGTACRVVENQDLLETMDHLSAKMKEEVKKLLNSKHLFFREMCAYHNSCGHNTSGVGGASGSGGGVVVASSSQAHQSQLEQQQQRCLHSSRIGGASSLVEGGGTKMPKGASGENDNDDDDNDDEDEEEEDEDEYDEVSGAHEHEDDNNDDTDERSRKKQRKLGTSMVQELTTELANVVQDRVKSPLEKRQWLKLRMMQLEEQHVSYQCQAFELQKQRLKWEKFISKKEKEMERDKLMNERKKLENERMVLLLKQKELELLDFFYQQHPNNNNNHRNSDPSSVTG